MDNNNNNKPYEDTFYIIPRWIRKLPGMTLGFLDVYETIFQFWNKDLECFLSIDSICSRTNLKRRHVFEALNFLEKKGVLKRIKDGKRNYFVKPDKKIEANHDSNIGALQCTDKLIGAPECTTQVRSSALNGCAPAHTEYKEENIKNINNKPLVDSVESPNKSKKNYRDDEWFMAFYNKYPNKQKPEVAYRAYLKHDVTLQFVKMIIKDVEDRMKNNWAGRDKSKIPHPSTYLNSREWEGELYKANNETKSTGNKRLTFDQISKWDVGA